MLAELVRRVCGIRTGETLDVRQYKLRNRVMQRVPASEQKRVLEFLGEIVGAHFSDEASVVLRAARKDAQLMSDQVRAAFADFLRAECDAGPVFVLLEDLHWGDAATVRILGTALGELAEKPLFLFAMARPEIEDVFPRLWAERALETRRLQQLGKKASEQLVRHVLGVEARASTIDRIVQLADGNPFYLEELIRATAEGRSCDLPQALVAMVQSRLGSLDEEYRRTLRAASILGETFWADGLAVLLGGDSVHQSVFAPLLRALTDAELITKRRESRFVGNEGMNACGFWRAGFVRQIHIECLLAADRIEDVKAAVADAHTWLHGMAEAMGDQNDRDSFLNNVPENRRLLELARALST